MHAWTAVRAGLLMCHALNMSALSCQIPGGASAGAAEFYQHHSFMRRLEQPQVLIQRGSYLQRRRSRSAVPVIAALRRAGRYLRPLWLWRRSPLFHCLKIQIV